ncbi:Rotatin [Nymphon striatum]|nr:Rotatin [Nymphon striatum]
MFHIFTVHPIEEIRIRTFNNLKSKLEHQVISVENLTKERELFVCLLEWFNFSEAKLKNEVLDLLFQFSKFAESCAIFVNIGGLEFLNKLKKYVGDCEQQIINDILENISKFSSDFLNDAECLFYTPLPKESVQPYNKTLPLQDSFLQPVFDISVSYLGKLGYFDKTEPLLVPQALNVSAPHDLKCESFKFCVFPWLSLTQTDRHVLSSTINSLEKYKEGTIMQTCYFLIDVVLHDFPPEVFLQRPDTIRSLLNLMLMTTDMHPYDILHIVKFFRILTTLLRDRMKYFMDPNFFTCNHDHISLSSSQLTSPSTLSTSQSLHFAGPESQRLSGDGQAEIPHSSCSRSSSNTIEDELQDVKDQQLTVPRFCSMLAEHSAQILKNCGVECAVTILEIMQNVIALFNSSVKDSIWVDYNNPAVEISASLLEAINSLAQAVMIWRPSDENSFIHQSIHLSVVSCFCQILSTLLPPSYLHTLSLSANVIDAIRETFLDDAIHMFLPHIHNALRDYVQEIDQSTCQLWDTCDIVCSSLKSACFFLKKCDLENKNELLFEEWISLTEEAILSISVHKRIDIIRKFVCCYSYICQRPNVPLSIINDGASVLLRCLAHHTVNIRKECYRKCFEITQEALDVENSVNTSLESSSNISFLMNSDIISEICMFGLCDENKEIAKDAHEILLHLLQSQLLMPERLWKKLISVISQIFPLIQAHVNLDTQLGKAILYSTDHLSSSCDGLPDVDKVKGNLRLLFHIDKTVRLEVAPRLLHYLSMDEECHLKFPQLSDLDPNSLCDVLIIKMEESVFEFNLSNKIMHDKIANFTYLMEMINQKDINEDLRQKSLKQVAAYMNGPDPWEKFGHPSCDDQSEAKLQPRTLMPKLGERFYHRLLQTFYNFSGKEIILRMIHSEIKCDLSTSDEDTCSITYIVMILQNILYFDPKFCEELSENEEIIRDLFRIYILYIQQYIYNYRGIALLSCAFKMLTKLINKRIVTNLSQHIPCEQFGFLPHKNTDQAISILINDINLELSTPRGKMYSVFVDFRKAFDSLDRPLLLSKLNEAGLSGQLFTLISTLLSGNYISIYDGLRYSEPVHQNKGVLQGDSLSPTLFLFYVADIIETLKTGTTSLKILMYADDLVFYSPLRLDIEKALLTLQKWSQENHLQVNSNKTKVMKFRKGGRLAIADTFFLDSHPLLLTNCYKYLGIALQTSLTFTKAIEDKKRKAYINISTLTSIHLLSIPTAITIFTLKILPIITYCLETLAPFLKLPHLKELDKTKSKYLKKALCLHTSSSSTMAHHLVEEKFLTETLTENPKFKFNKSVIEEYRKFRKERNLNFTSENYIEGPAFSFACIFKGKPESKSCVISIFLLLFYEVLYPVKITGEKIYEDFSIPFLLSKRYAWNFTWHEGFHRALQNYSSDFKDSSQISSALSLDLMDLECLKRTERNSATQIAIDNLNQASSHGEADHAVWRILLEIMLSHDVHLYDTNKIEDGDKCIDFILKEQWIKAFDKYIFVAPSSGHDEMLLRVVLAVMSRVLSITSSKYFADYLCEAFCCHSSPLYTNLHPLSDANTKENKVLQKQILTLLINVIKNSSDSKREELCLGELVFSLQESITLTDESPFYNLANLEAILSCLVHITTIENWSSTCVSSNPRILCQNSISSLIQIISAFHTGRGETAQSFMGKGITKSASLVLQHTLVEMIRISSDKEWLQLFMHKDGPDSQPMESNWLNPLWTYHDPEVRAAGLGIAVQLSSIPQGCEIVIQNCASVAEGVWGATLSILLDNGEAAIVRKWAALVLSNLIAHVENIEDSSRYKEAFVIIFHHCNFMKVIVYMLRNLYPLSYVHISDMISLSNSTMSSNFSSFGKTEHLPSTQSYNQDPMLRLRNLSLSPLGTSDYHHSNNQDPVTSTSNHSTICFHSLITQELLTAIAILMRNLVQLTESDFISLVIKEDILPLTLKCIDQCLKLDSAASDISLQMYEKMMDFCYLCAVKEDQCKDILANCSIQFCLKSDRVSSLKALRFFTLVSSLEIDQVEQNKPLELTYLLDYTMFEIENFVKDIIDSVKSILANFNFEGALSYKKKGLPCVIEMIININLLNNMAYESPEIKKLFYSNKLSQILTMVWNWCLTNENLMECSLNLIATYIHCFDKGCVSLTTSFQNSNLTKSQNSNSVAQCVINLMEKESLLLDVFFKSMGSKSQRNKFKVTLGKQIIDILLVLSKSTEGQAAITRSSENISVLADCVKVNENLVGIKTQCIVRNLTFHQSSKQKILSNNTLILNMIENLTSSDRNTVSLSLSTIWSLIANNQKAKQIFKKENVNARLEESLYMYHSEDDLRKKIEIVCQLIGKNY